MLHTLPSTMLHTLKRAKGMFWHGLQYMGANEGLRQPWEPDWRGHQLKADEKGALPQGFGEG